MVETSKNLLLQNHQVDCFETWYVASGDWELPNVYKCKPRLTLTCFSSRSNLVHWAFEWRKGETLSLSKTVLSLDMKVGCTRTSIYAKGRHSMNKLANQQTSKLSIPCYVFSKDTPSEVTWQIGSQFVCIVHVFGFYVLVSWKSLFIFGCYGNTNNYDWRKIKSLVTNQ